MLRKGKKFYAAKNGDTGEKRKPDESNTVIWIYCFLNLQIQDASSYYFVAFLNHPKLFIESESIFFVQEIYGFFITLETVC